MSENFAVEEESELHGDNLELFVGGIEMTTGLDEDKE